MNPLLSLCLALAPQDAPAEVAPAADLVVYGSLFTANAESPRAEALAIAGERIVAVGRRAEIAVHVGEATRVLDAGDASVVPGFNDAHAHFTVSSGMALDIDLGDAGTLEELLDAVRTQALAHPDAAVLQGGYWDLADFPGDAAPTAAMLDEAVPDRPVLLWSEGPHGVWANSAALVRAGFDAETEFPENTLVLRDAEGAPSGVFLGRGLLFLFPFLPFPDFAEVQAGIRAGLAQAARLGVTSVHESVSPFLLPYLVQLHDGGELTLRFHVWGMLHAGFRGGGVDAYAQLEQQHARGSWITFGTLKGGVDGMPGLRTAAMLEDYSDAPGQRGSTFIELETLAAEIEAANRAGYAAALHATGDRGVRLCLDAIERARGAAPRMNRIEHAFVVAPADVPRFAELEVIASVQPGFLSVELAKGRYYDRRFGERADDVMPLRSLIDAGATLAFGTDYGLTPLDPRVALFAACARTELGAEPGSGWVPEQRIALTEALYAYTLGSARAEGRAHEKGSLAPGMLADLVIFEQDLFALQPAALLEATVSATVVGGRIVYEKP